MTWPLRTNTWGAIHALILLAVIPVMMGCRTPAPPGPVDLAEPGWTIRRGQALWQPRKRAPELAGQFLIASRPDGQDFIRFSKEPMEIVLARRLEEGWWMEIPALDRSYSGRGRPPERLAWFSLASAVFRDAVPGGWSWSGIEDGRWTLVHRRTGERLEGVFRE